MFVISSINKRSAQLYGFEKGYFGLVLTTVQTFIQRFQIAILNINV